MRRHKWDVRRHKWGIFWLIMLAWNAASLGSHLDSNSWGRASLDLFIVVWMGVMAYYDLTLQFARHE